MQSIIVDFFFIIKIIYLGKTFFNIFIIYYFKKENICISLSLLEMIFLDRKNFLFNKIEINYYIFIINTIFYRLMHLVLYKHYIL